MSTVASKSCPDCAEELKGDARVCRFCGYRFETTDEALLPQTPVPPPEVESSRSSVAGAGVSPRIFAAVAAVVVVAAVAIFAIVNVFSSASVPSALAAQYHGSQACKAWGTAAHSAPAVPYPSFKGNLSISAGAKLFNCSDSGKIDAAAFSNLSVHCAAVLNGHAVWVYYPRAGSDVCQRG
jgi:hypothetical protein